MSRMKDVVPLQEPANANTATAVQKKRGITPWMLKKAKAGEAVIIGDVPIDNRTRLARRWQEIYADLADQLGGDPSVTQSLLLRRAATICVQLERIDVLTVGEEEGAFNPSSYSALTRTLTGVLNSLGLARSGKGAQPGASSRRAPPVIDGYASALMDEHDADSEGDAE